MDWVKVESSNIEAVAFEQSNPLNDDPLSRGVLAVKFKNGDVYRYLNVPRDIYEQMLDAPSKGTFFNTIIKDTYVSVKQTEDALPNREITVQHLKNVADAFKMANRVETSAVPLGDEGHYFIPVSDELTHDIIELLNDAVRLLEA